MGYSASCIASIFEFSFQTYALTGDFLQVYRSEETENIGYVIPTTVVSHFLTDYERNAKYTGKKSFLIW